MTVDKLVSFLERLFFLSFEYSWLDFSFGRLSFGKRKEHGDGHVFNV